MGKRNIFHRGTLLVIFLFVSFALSACSQVSTSVTDVDFPKTLQRDITERILWGLWELDISPTGEITVRGVRAGTAHVNVLEMLLPPNCNDCLIIEPQGFFPAEHRLEADITLRNWTGLFGNDVRGILISDVGHDLYNADDYTGLWDNGGAVSINPFKRFPPDPGPYLFYPGAIETVHYSLKTPQPPMWASILMAVDVSWPNACPEPFNIGPNGKVIFGELNENGGTINCYVDVFTHLSPVESVVLDLSPIGGSEVDLAPWDDVPGLANYFAAFDIPFAGYSQGEYEIWLKTQTGSSGIWLYDKIHVEVFPDGQFIPRPIVVGTIPYPFSKSGIGTKDGYLFALGASGLNIYTIETDGSLTLHSEAPFPSEDVDAFRLFIGENLVFGYFERWDYLASSLLVFDVSSLTEPLARGTMTGLPIFGDAVVKEDYLICSIPAWERIASIDAADPDEPVWSGNYNANEKPWAVELEGFDLYAIHEGKGVGVYSVSNPASPSPKGIFAWTKVMELPFTISNDYGYLWGNDGQLGIFSYETPTFPTLVSATTMKEGWDGDTITGFYIHNDFLFAWGETCYVIRISDPENPELVFEPPNEVIAPDTSNGIAFWDRFAYTPHDGELELIRGW